MYHYHLLSDNSSGYIYHLLVAVVSAMSMHLARLAVGGINTENQPTVDWVLLESGELSKG